MSCNPFKRWVRTLILYHYFMAVLLFTFAHCSFLSLLLYNGAKLCPVKFITASCRINWRIVVPARPVCLTTKAATTMFRMSKRNQIAFPETAIPSYPRLPDRRYAVSSWFSCVFLCICVNQSMLYFIQDTTLRLLSNWTWLLTTRKEDGALWLDQNAAVSSKGYERRKVHRSHKKRCIF